ncbi:MAG TPA: tetratricopeptide repeat protein, partial [Chitinophagaceae bacterium]|nr:tetratricopeptide repeat protein [Chitinophagaceae bacterium]
MRNKILLLSLVLIPIYGFLAAQSPVIDSLRGVLQKRTLQDTSRVNTLVALARELRRNNPKQCDSVLEVASSLANQLNYAKGKGLILIIRAVRQYEQSRYPLAYKTFDEAKKILETVNDKKAMAYLYRSLATLQKDDGKNAESIGSLLTGLKLAGEAGDTKTVIEIEGTIGYMYNILGEYEKAIPYQEDALKQAQRIGYKYGMSTSYNAIGKTYKTSGNYPASLDAYSKGLKLSEEDKDSSNIFIAHSNIADVYERMGNYQQTFFHVIPAWNFFQKSKTSPALVPWDEWVMARAFTHSGNADSGLYYGKHALMLSYQIGYRLYLREMTQIIAEAAAKLRQWDTAYKYQVLSSHYKDSLVGEDIARKTAMLQASFDLDKKQTEIALLKKDKDLQMAENRKERAFLVMVLGGLATVIVLAVILFRNNRQKQKANVLLQKQKREIDNKARELSVQKDELEQSYRNVQLLSEIGRKITSSLSVEKIIGTVYDNVNSMMDAAVFGIGIYNDALKRIEFPSTYEEGKALPFYSNSIYEENRFGALCFISGKEIIMGSLGEEYQNYVQSIPTPKAGNQAVSLVYLPLKAKEKVLGVLTVQSFEKNAYSDYHIFMLRNIAIYTAIALENADAFQKLNQTLTSLKQTQSQLIQAEKMASLGELTAGIAHEIQNPLNFVNNFSDVSVELAGELKESLSSLNFNGKEGESVSQIIDDLIQNQQKINFHGRRADAIVKGMLMHSRTSSGQKELTDINALADEYLRLSYHGLRAKDKTFMANFKTHFDPAIEKVNIIPQDIGRVILNLFTNAFYSVTEKKKQLNGDYEPTVMVTTQMVDGKVELKVKDNGIGIPQKVLDK